MQWIEVSVPTRSDEIDDVCAQLAELGAGGMVVEDEADFQEFLEHNHQYWDYVDDALEAQFRGVSRIKFYLSDDDDGRAQLETIRAGIGRELTTATVRDSDWENNWRQYYQPIAVGEKLVVVPEWLDAPADGRVALRLDPGLIFGTGSHPTTRMCLAALERCAGAGKTVLDLGCGSGILGIGALLAAVPRGLPKPVLPDLTALPFTEALVATLPVAAVILAETLLASSGTAQKNGYRLNGRREIAAYAVCNVAAGLVGCCVVSGSVSRTAVNERNGGKTQLVSVTASVTMLLVLLFATPLIRFLPVPVLTAIVVNALIGATEFGIARRLWRVNRVELGIFAGAFLGVLLLGAIKGVLVGMVLSFVDVLMRAAAPQRTFLGTLPGKAGFFPIDRVSGVQPLPHIVLYRFSGSLFFANIRRFQEDIEGALQPDTQAVIVDGSAVVSVDITACDRLVALNRKLRAQGVRFYLTEHIGEVNDQLRHFEAGELIETGAVRRTIRGALRDAGVTLDPGSSYQQIPGNMDDIRQLQELEWLYGADAEVQIERNVQLMLARMRTTDDVRARRAMLEHFLNEDFHFGSIDADEVLLHLEGHTDELAQLLGNSEDDVFTDLEVERDSLIDRVEQDYPELVEHVRERRDHLDHDFHTNHPSSAARIDARRQQLRARIERERAERGERRAQHQAELLERHEQHAAAHQERHEQHATEQQLRHERQLEERLRRQAEAQVAREQRQAAELAKKAQRAAERARRHAEHSAERAQKHAEELARKMQRHADRKAERLERHAAHEAKHEHKHGDED